MIKVYRVEVSIEQITPVTVKASSEEEAEELALLCVGEFGDSYPGELKVLNSRCLDNE